MRGRVTAAMATAWAWFANLSGATLIVIALAYALIVSVTNEGLVIETVAPTELRTPSVPYMGTVEYLLTTRRNLSCPGAVVYTLTSTTNHGPPATVTWRRPVISVDLRPNDDARPTLVSLQLSEAVFPGRWRLVSAVDSQCPTFRRLDNLADVQIEVTPP